MDLDMKLSYGVTLLGFLLCLFSMAIIVFGKKSVGERGSPQVIRFKQLEVQTNSVLMLFIVSVVVAALPLLLAHYRPITPGASISPAPPPEKRPLYITGYVQKPDGMPLEGAKIVLFTLAPDGSSQKISEQTAESDGSFMMSHTLAQGDRLRMVTAKAGYVNQTLILGIDSLTYPAVLVQKR